MMIHMIETYHELTPRLSFEDLHERFVVTFRYGISPIEDRAYGGRHFYLAKPRSAPLTPDKLAYGTVYTGEGLPLQDGTNNGRWLASYFDVTEKESGKVGLKLRTSLPEFFKRDMSGVWLRGPQVSEAMRKRWGMVRTLLDVPRGATAKRVTHNWRMMELCWQVRCDSPHLDTVGTLLGQQDPGGLGWMTVQPHYAKAEKGGVYRKVYAKGLERMNRGRRRGASHQGVETDLMDLLRCEVTLNPTDAQERTMWRILDPVDGKLDRRIWYDEFRKRMPHLLVAPEAKITPADRKRLYKDYSAAEGVALCALMNDAKERTELFRRAAENPTKYGKLARKLREEMDRCRYDLGVIPLVPPDDYDQFTHICEAYTPQCDRHAAENPFQGVSAHLVAEWEEHYTLLTV